MTENSIDIRLFYADGAVPRYSGCPSARVLTLGGSIELGILYENTYYKYDPQEQKYFIYGPGLSKYNIIGSDD